MIADLIATSIVMSFGYALWLWLNEPVETTRKQFTPRQDIVTFKYNPSQKEKQMISSVKNIAESLKSITKKKDRVSITPYINNMSGQLLFNLNVANNAQMQYVNGYSQQQMGDGTGGYATVSYEQLVDLKDMLNSMDL